MIDFRYHLISLIAVFLALGLGILMGSVVLDQAFIDRLEGQVAAFDRRNDRLQQQIDLLDQRQDASGRFVAEASTWLLDDALTGRTVVLVEVEGTDGQMVDDIREAIQEGEGEVTGTVTLTDRLELGSAPDRDELALALGSTSERGRELREETGALIGNRIAAAAAEAGTTEQPQSAARERLGGALGALEEGGFVAVDPDDPDALVPPAAMFLIVGGAEEEPSYDVNGALVSLVRGLAERGAPSMVAEPSYSTWGIVTSVRDDAEAAGEVSTVDQAETQEGRVAIVLGLERGFEGSSGHYGVRDGATEVLPAPPEE